MEQYHLCSYSIFLKELLSFQTSVLNAEHFRVVIKRLFQSQVEHTGNEVPFQERERKTFSLVLAASSWVSQTAGRTFLCEIPSL